MSAVADGAGSAAHSEIGASVATQTAVDAAIRLIEVRGPGFTAADLRACFDAANKALASESQSREISVRDLACTLLVVVVGPRIAHYGQIGDGAIITDVAGTLSRAIPAESTEFVNLTYFVTNSNYENHLRVVSAPAPDWVAVVTDGVEFLSVNDQTDTPNSGFFVPFVSALRAADDESQLVVPTKMFLQSDRVNARTDDDKTLLLAVWVQ